MTPTHSGPRYLEPIVYERAESGGWIVPEAEQERFHNPPRFPAPTRPEAQPRPLQHLVVELEAWIDLDAALERQLRDTYELAPMKVTRAVATVVSSAQAGRLTGPAGLLVKRLREIAAGSGAS